MVEMTLIKFGCAMQSDYCSFYDIGDTGIGFHNSHASHIYI